MKVAAVHNPGSTGISRYCRRLAEALAVHGVEYELAASTNGVPSHAHFGNSSRRALLGVRGGVITLHDILPRARALQPLQRHALPRLLRHASAVVVHSCFAADLLARAGVLDQARVEVIPHPATSPVATREAARRELGWPKDVPVALLPGVIKRAKLAREAIEAAAPLIRDRRVQLVLAGRVRDRRAAETAVGFGATILRSPDDRTYDLAMAAADVVFVLRAGSVGETNGPLLEALGAGKAILATANGSIPELTSGAAVLCGDDAVTIRAGLSALLDPTERADRATAAARQATRYSWDASAHAHAELFRSVFGG